MKFSALRVQVTSFFDFVKKRLNEELRPLPTYKKYKLKIQDDHEKFRKYATKRVESSNQKAAVIKEELEAVERLIKSGVSKGTATSAEARLELERISAKIRSSSDNGSVFYEGYIKKVHEDYIYQTGLLAKYARNLSVSTIVALTVVLILFYFAYRIFFPDFGKGVSLEYYIALSQILPVLLVALYFSGRDKESDVIQQTEKVSIWTRLIHDYRLIGMYAFLVGELACLFAIARDRTGMGVFVFTLIGASMLTILTFGKITEQKK